MGLRDQINRHPRITYGVTGGIICVLAIFVYLELRLGGRPPLPSFPKQAYYTDDDGGTLFADVLTHDPPFDHQGREAVRAHVFSCDGGAHRWVQYLDKFTDAAKKQMQDDRTSRAQLLALAAEPAVGMSTGLLVKKPGAGDWVADSSAQGRAIMEPKCPDGQDSATLTELNP